LTLHPNLTGKYETLGLFARLRQAALHHFHIEPALFHAPARYRNSAAVSSRARTERELRVVFFCAKRGRYPL
jgi:hypothetical protein